ncbi:hypothetical protein HF864_04820 [Lactobacillus sp. MRS-253-APC-2B]|uniref:hypothetical protein n=1 Tax=Lactobacillus sp. MRS-253-APC-2B TaxID=2725305 RepID=UPI00146A1098|nr:hypothetical protein [Lactobacillus sp. MRS-253-APC-2B]NME34108.1 hypothetical protein [Lactobacillus sp. MRS-253-APC-2B]
MIKTLTLIDAICAIALFITVFMGLHAKMEKRVSDWFVLTCLALIVAAITALATTLMFFHLHPLLFVGRIIWLLIALFAIEAAFRQKRETFGNPWLFFATYLILIINVVINIW